MLANCKFNQKFFQLSDIMNLSDDINQVPCQSSCWGRRYTPVVCYERRRPYTSHSPRPVATKNKIDATLSLRFLRTQAAFYRARNDISLPSYEEPCTSWPPVEKCIHCLSIGDIFNFTCFSLGGGGSRVV